MKTATIACTTCKQEFDIPESMLPKDAGERAIICPYRMRLGMKGVHPDDLEKEMKTRKGEIAIDMLLDRTSEAYTEAAFPELWKAQKEYLKALSKRDLAEESFGAGVNAFLDYIMRNQKSDKERIRILKQMKEIFEHEALVKEVDDL